MTGINIVIKNKYIEISVKSVNFLTYCISGFILQRKTIVRVTSHHVHYGIVSSAMDRCNSAKRRYFLLEHPLCQEHAAYVDSSLDSGTEPK